LQQLKNATLATIKKCFQMLNNVDEASPEKTKKRKRRIQAEILQDFKKKLAEANKNNKTMTKELLEKKLKN
jgi:hypothetical protein